MKALIVYYSRTGNTAKIAQAINKEMDSNVEDIRDTKNRNGISGFLISCMESALKKQPEIKKAKYNPDEYDLVIIGTPVWAGTIASPVRTYLEQYKKSFKAAAYFYTSDSNGNAKVLREMEILAGCKAEALLEITKTDLATETFQEKVKIFVQELLQSQVY
jgi:flavodoxin